MPYRVEQFVNGEIYHVVLRAIDDNLIFKNVDDYYRGVFSIYEFNNKNPVSIKERRKIRAKIKKIQSARGRASGADVSADERDRLVDILAFCFMPNHLHLLTKQLKGGGITKFMSKLGTGYGGYFNRKYGRKGYVFQDRFLTVHVANDDQLKNIFVYIHTNPVALIESNWKEKGIKSPRNVIKFLENYKWSSYQDYIGKRNFPSVTERDFIRKTMGKEKGCRRFVKNWIEHKSRIREFAKLFLED